MKRLFATVIVIIIFFTNSLSAQQLFTNTNIQNAYRNETRDRSGKPGKNYWQNRADYQISANFDPATQLLQGNEIINYKNNSPDTLEQIIIRLYPDLYKKGVARLSNIAEKDLGNGVQIESLRIGNENITSFSDSEKAYRAGTLLYLIPAQEIMPHSEIKFEISWHYKVNTGSPVRTGMVDSTSYFIAYFFPRISVYDDVDGWDTWSYNGVEEFYNDFGNYNVAVSVPKGFVVWATGDRQNSADNFDKNVLDKINKASISTDIIHIIDSTDYLKKDIFKKDASATWKFSASNITDFAFALSDHYLWDASSVLVDSATGRRTVAGAAYNKIHKDYFDVADQAHQTVFYTSHFYPKYPFPFNHITVFDGTDQMEYPMMANDNPTFTHKDAVQLTTHEIFHSYFPFFMGTNETQYAWMDEGWASIGESLISPKMGEPEDDGIFSKKRYEEMSGTDRDVPLITNTKEYPGTTYLANSYGKGGSCYYVLQDMLGDSLYFKALHQYMNEWNGKHPTPYDFFYSINSGSGKNLDWFWQRWFFGWEYPDLSIKNVAKNGSQAKITIENKGGLPVPIYLTIISKSGEKTIQKYTAGVWENGDKEKSLIVPKSYSDISEIKLGNEFIPDKFITNNTWERK